MDRTSGLDKVAEGLQDAVAGTTWAAEVTDDAGVVPNTHAPFVAVVLDVVDVGVVLDRLPNIPKTAEVAAGATTGPNRDGRVDGVGAAAVKRLGAGVVVAPKTLPVPSVEVVDAAGAAGRPDAAAVVTVAAVRVGLKLLWKGDGELGLDAA